MRACVPGRVRAQYDGHTIQGINIQAIATYNLQRTSMSFGCSCARQSCAGSWLTCSGTPTGLGDA